MLLTAGTFADLYGRRRIFALGIALFTLGTASGLVNTARMVGATLGVAVLGAIFAVVAGGSPDAGHIAAGLPPAFIVGGIGEMLGAAAALFFIRRSSLPR